MADVTTTTGLTGSGGGNMIRITGMASGLDVDALVKKMLTADQIKIDTASKNNQTVQWKKDAYTSIIAGIKDLQSSFFDVTSSSTSVLSDTAYTAFDITGLPLANGVISTAASISADATAQEGTYSIGFTKPDSDINSDDPIDGNLAKTAGVTSSTLMTTTVPSVLAVNSTKLSDIGFTMGHNLVINYNNNDGKGEQSKTIAFATTDTLNDITTRINTETGNSVQARYSELTGTLSIQTSMTGANTTISVSSDSGVLAKLGLGVNATTATISGLDANVYITPPGASTGTLVTRSSNNFTIDGISYNLTTGEDSKFSVFADLQKVYDKISGFLDKYNGLVGQIQTAVDAKGNSDYPPLTAAQQTSMSATDIANWNIKAQVGSLSNDKNLTKMLSDMRSAFTSLVDSTGLSFGKYGTNAIGIDTSTDVTQGGKITITSKTQLMNAITVYKYFNKYRFN